jgi:DNA-binding winged helix-turn-helix (wHTH) protein
VEALSESPDTLHAGELEIRPDEGLVRASGHALTLSVREFELLVAMGRRIGAICTREELYGAVWGGQLRPGDRSVDVYVSKLRAKLEAAMPDRSFIHTHPGFGYRFQPQPARESVAGSRATAAKVGATRGDRGGAEGDRGRADRPSQDLYIGAAGG